MDCCLCRRVHLSRERFSRLKRCRPSFLARNLHVLPGHASSKFLQRSFKAPKTLSLWGMLCCVWFGLVGEATTTADQLTSGGVRSSPSKLVQRNVMSLVFSSGVGFSYGVWWDPKNRKTQFCGKTNLIWTMLKILCISHQPTIPFLLRFLSCILWGWYQTNRPAAIQLGWLWMWGRFEVSHVLFFPMFGIITISRTFFQWNCP